MIPKTFSALCLCLVLLLLCGSASAQAKNAVCEAGNLKFTCPEDFEKLPNIDATTSLFKFQYKDTLVYFFVANPSGKFDQTSVMNGIATYYPGGVAAPFRWKNMKEPLMMSMRTLHEREVGSWIGYDGTHLLTLRTAAFKINDQNVVFGYAWEAGSKVDNKESKFKKASDIGDQSFGCNAMATTLNSVTREFPQGRQYCFSTGPGN